ncbi:MAG TPA: DUF6502 family protein [Candidatus Acidoferrales bacterium]|nr:DUF6502 family protein [Candidatus Acidoferrales bacterium]
MTGDDVAGNLIWACSEIFRPLVRRLLALGIPFGVLEAHLRQLFVEVADAEFALPGRPQTDSRIALLTGINRKEVRRIRAAEGHSEPRSFAMNHTTSLISRWLTDPRSSDQRGRPRPLPYSAERGPSFVKLARRVTVDLAPGVLLAELLRSGAAELQDGNIVVLKGDSYVPTADIAEKLQILAEDPAELVSTILRNIFADDETALLQRKVYFDNIGSDAVQTVRDELRREGERFLRRANRLLSRHDRDRNPHAAGGERFYSGIGVYVFDAPFKAASKGRTKPAPTPRRSSKERK